MKNIKVLKIVGPQNVGKGMFINALLGEEIADSSLLGSYNSSVEYVFGKGNDVEVWKTEKEIMTDFIKYLKYIQETFSNAEFESMIDSLDVSNIAQIDPNLLEKFESDIKNLGFYEDDLLKSASELLEKNGLPTSQKLLIKNQPFLKKIIKYRDNPILKKWRIIDTPPNSRENIVEVGNVYEMPCDLSVYVLDGLNPKMAWYDIVNRETIFVFNKTSNFVELTTKKENKKIRKSVIKSFIEKYGEFPIMVDSLLAFMAKTKSNKYLKKSKSWEILTNKFVGDINGTRKFSSKEFLNTPPYKGGCSWNELEKKIGF